MLLISMINGNMRTPKIYSLYNLIDWFNYNFKEINISKNLLNYSFLDSNAWLSGFIEAEGHFLVRITLTSKKPKIECKFELSKRQIDHEGNNNFYFLEVIAKFLFSSVKEIRVNKSNQNYRIRTASLNSNLILVNYLKNFPLFGSKYLDYIYWMKVLEKFQFGQFKHKLNLNKLFLIKSNMNDARTVFIWDHLNKFYNLD